METDIEPHIIWKYFAEISRIPRCSKHEERVADYIVTVAKNYGLEVLKDENGNVIARKQAQGYDDAPMVTLQAHMDMVCEKNKDVDHDFNTDPIETYVDGEWMKAQGTTLGADNGIGVATCLALMEADDIKHGPLEFLLTVDEETGLTGAFRLKKEAVKGDLLVNLDSEDWGVIFIGCAGGGDSNLTLPLAFERVSGNGYRIHVKGLKGGHSGIEIDKGRANAVKLLVRTLHACGARVADIEGGDKHNAIPREASADIVAEGGIEETVRMMERAFKDEYGTTEPDLRLTVEPCKIARAADQASNDALLRLLLALPHGVMAMSQDVPGLVETSTNLATVRIADEKAVILTSSRSSIKSALEYVRLRIATIAALAGASVEQGDAYPGWKPNLESRLLALASDAYRERYGEDIKKEAIHAGLETGVLGEITGIQEIISIGPQIEHPHSPDERVNIPSTENFWEYLVHLLEKVATEW
jgi:dipeptidase D